MDLDPSSPTFEKWQNLTVQEGRPPGRIDHSAVYDPKRNRMVINAGWTKTRKGLFTDMWAFYFDEPLESKGRWAKIDTSTLEPPERRFAVALHEPERNWYVMFGGQGSNGLLNDVWVFDLDADVVGDGLRRRSLSGLILELRHPFLATNPMIPAFPRPSGAEGTRL